MCKQWSFLLLAAFVAFALQVESAAAQATRTWVSGVGDDANPCSRTAPCKTFAGAISKTASGGEINTLDGGGFGFVTITKPISIIAGDGLAGILNSGATSVTVNAPAGSRVLLEGLDIEGAATTFGQKGIRIMANNIVTIRKCRIRNQSVAGVEVAGPQGTRVTIEDTQISNATTGVSIVGLAGAANSVTIIDSTIERNSTGVEVTGSNVVMLRGSNIFGNAAKDLSLVGGSAKANSTGDNLIVSGDEPTKLISLK